jgi:hypothetical protein
MSTLSTTEGVQIQHARNGGGKEIGPYKVDGYYENENGQKYVLELWFVGINRSPMVIPLTGLTVLAL